MLIDFGSTIVNTDHIRTIEHDMSSPGTASRIKITFADGTKTQALYSYEDARALCGVIVPAPAGYQVVTRFEEEDGSLGFDLVPVLAFRVADEEEGFPLTAITMEGRPTGGHAVVYPNGRTIDEHGTSYDTPEDYQKSVREQFGK